LLNGSRLGFYEPIRKSLNRLVGVRPEDGLVVTALTAGALTGCIGGKSVPSRIGIIIDDDPALCSCLVLLFLLTFQYDLLVMPTTHPRFYTTITPLDLTLQPVSVHPSSLSKLGYRPIPLLSPSAHNITIEARGMLSPRYYGVMGSRVYGGE